MNDLQSRPSASPLDTGLVLAVLTVIGGLILATRTFRSPREPGESMTLPPGASQQTISFNHLRDPFQAIPTGQPKDDSSHLKGEVDSIDATSGTSGTRNRLILCTLPGGSTSEDQEARLRARQAVLSGLIRSGFSASM